MFSKDSYKYRAIIEFKKRTIRSYSFSLDNYNAGACGLGHNLSSDIPQGNATYDAATANMGSPWKIPTKAQLQELINETSYNWTSMNGAYGYKFNNITDTSKFIFLPVGGYWNDTTLNPNGPSGFYLSVSIHEKTKTWAYSLYIRYNVTPQTSTFNRYQGLSVRAII